MTQSESSIAAVARQTVLLYAPHIRSTTQTTVRPAFVSWPGLRFAPWIIVAAIIFTATPAAAQQLSEQAIPETASGKEADVASQPTPESPATPVTAFPDPLTLDFALNLDTRGYPGLQIVQSQLDYKIATQESIDARTDLNIFITADARYIEPAEVAPDQNTNDSRYGLSIRSNLYDFGRTGAASDAALAEIKSGEWMLIDAAKRHRIGIMSAYFDVLLADLTYIRDNEAMSIGFIRFDRMRMRTELGQHSDIELLEAEKNYHITRKNLFQSRAQQQITRAKLATLLNRPDELSSGVAEPALSYVADKPATVEELTELALAVNPQLKALRQQVSAARFRVKSARAGRYPTLKGRIDVFEYERTGSGYHDATVALKLDVPLWQGDAVTAEIARQQAGLQQIRARLIQHERDVRQAVLELRHELDILRIERREKAALIDFRDLFLDRSRALYEMEVKTELGDSMTKVSDARLQYARAKYNTALVLARLNALTGRPVFPGREQK